jgi:hypothetical protein
VSTQRLTPVDAQTFWLSAKIPNDTFLLFGFDGVPANVEQAVAEALSRARATPSLTVRIADRGFLKYPAVVHRDVDRAQFVVHDLEDPTWAGCLAAVTELVDDQLDAQKAAWRLHVFAPVDGVPGAAGAGTVAVLQISHAFGGGGRTTVSAAQMFGRVGAVVPGIGRSPAGPIALPAIGLRAARAHRQLLAEVDAGLVPPQAELRPLLRTNARPSGPRALRTVVKKRSELSGATVTVALLSAVSVALAGHLRELGDDPSTLGAEVPMAKPPPRLSYNHFGNVGVGLYPDLPSEARSARISDDLAARRLRAGHDAMRAADLAFAATPAPLLRWGMGQFDPDVRPPAVTGNTIVSSVNCGAADFAFGGAPVTLATAVAGLSPMMGLTHVVFGVGDTLAVGVHAAESAVGGRDGLAAYVARLDAVLGSESSR